MGKLGVLFIFVFCGFTQSFAQDNLELREAWARTGYGLVELYSEPDFQAESCKESETLFVACLMALRSMLSSIEESPHDLQLNGIEFAVVPELPQTEPMTNDEYRAQQMELRANFAFVYQVGVLNFLDDLYKEVAEVINNNAPASDIPYLAGRAYNIFLRNAYDPHSKLIPYSQYAPQPQIFFGIGANVVKYKDVPEDHMLYDTLAVNPKPGSPAERAGLVRGDLILEVNGQKVAGVDISEVVSWVKGELNTFVTFKVHGVCENDIKEIVVQRGEINASPDMLEDSGFIALTQEKSDPINSVCSEGADQPSAGESQALYVRLLDFSPRQDQEHGEICSQFLTLQGQDLDNPDSLGMIVDLRGNPGGSLYEVMCMLDSVISSDQTMIELVGVDRGELNGEVQRGRFRVEGRLMDSDAPGQVFTYNKKIVVLVDAGSASASEIFSGAVQDMQRGWIVGNRTFGKGSAQSIRQHSRPPEHMEPGDEPIMIGMTSAIYTLPSGRSPQQFGIIPDFRFDYLGEPIVDEEDFVTSEGSSFNSIEFLNNQWEQTRPGDLAALSSCAQGEESISEAFKNSLGEDERYNRAFVADYQLLLAKDILLCDQEREDVISH